MEKETLRCLHAHKNERCTQSFKQYHHEQQQKHEQHVARFIHDQVCKKVVRLIVI